MKTTEYSEIHKDDLIAILRQNVPKYFSEHDIADFQEYLRERKWDRHDVFVDQDHTIQGCASYYMKSPSAIGLCWMFFTPLRIGPRRMLRTIEEYLTSIQACVGILGKEFTFTLNTTPQVARFLARIGFVKTETVKNGYGSGYDKVSMERRK